MSDDRLAQLPPELLNLARHDPLVATAVARYEASPYMTVLGCLTLVAEARLLASCLRGANHALPAFVAARAALWRAWDRAAYLARAARLSRAGLRRRGSNGWG